jgi:hypothetical protein
MTAFSGCPLSLGVNSLAAIGQVNYPSRRARTTSLAILINIAVGVLESCMKSHVIGAVTE